VLIPLNENTGVMIRDGLGYPCTFKSSGLEILGFYAPSMRKATEFFYPDSYITYKELALPYYKPIEGQIKAEEELQTQLAPLDGQILPRGDGAATIFIRKSLTKLQGTFKDNDGKLAATKVLVIPGHDMKPDEFYPIDDSKFELQSIHFMW